jgi:PA14 domain
LTSEQLPPDRPVPGKWKAAALYALLTLVLMYPVSVRPGSVAPGDGPDTQLGVWMLAWDVHAFTHQPLRIFDANTFYPLPRTLAYQDNLIGSALVAAPVMWLTGNPVLGLNVVSLVACVLCGLGGYMLARRLGLSAPAALLCGFIFAFCPARFFRYSQIGLAPVQWIPLTLASLHAYLDGGGRRQLWFALGFFTLQTLTSGHAAVFLVVAILTVLAYRFALGEPILLWRRIRDFGIPGALLLMPAVLSYLPYRMNQVEHGLRRGIGSWGNPLGSFLASPTHFHMYLMSLMGLGDINKNAYGFLFMGYLPTLLALTAAVMLIVLRRRRVDQDGRPPLLVPVLQLGLILAALWWALRLYAVFAHAATTSDAALASMVVPALATGGLGLALLLAYRRRGPTVGRSARLALAVLVSAALPFALIGLLRPLMPAGNGTHARYFPNVEWSGYPAMTVVDPRPSAEVFTDRWNDRPPPSFSVRWTGYITVGRAGTYEFATTSDDGTRLTINDQRVVSNEGSHSPVMQSGTIELSAGSHRYVLDYVQYGGPYALEWTWADDKGSHHPVPTWRLSQQRTTIATAIARRLLDAISWACLAAAFAFVLWWLHVGGAELSEAVAAWSGSARRNPAPLYLLMTLLCVGLSLGPPYSLWPYVYSWPGLNFIRAPLRFMVLGALGVAVLAAIGFDRLTSRLSLDRRRTAAFAVAALMLVEFVGVPVFAVPFAIKIPPADQWLAQQPKPFVVAEVPVDPGYERHQTTYMMHSMAHWQRTVAGFGGIRPAFHQDLDRLLNVFPNDASVRRLVEIGVTHVVVHIDLYEPAVWPAVDARLRSYDGTWLKLEYSDPIGRVYSIHRPGLKTGPYLQPPAAAPAQ